MNIAITTAVWGRPLTTRLFWEGARRLARLWAPHEVSVWAVGSEPEHRALAGEYGGRWVEHENEPLSRKWNAVMGAAYDAGADYGVVLGSDDVMTDALGREYLQVMERGALYSGIASCVMVEPLLRRALRLTGHANPIRWGETIGAGRLLSRRLLDLVGGRPWPDKATRGLDWRMTLKLQKLGVTGTDVRMLGTGDAMLVDVKGAGMWSFDRVAKHTHVAQPAEYESIVALLVEPEQRILRTLEMARCPTCGTPSRM